MPLVTVKEHSLKINGKYNNYFDSTVVSKFTEY